MSSVTAFDKHVHFKTFVNFVLHKLWARRLKASKFSAVITYTFSLQIPPPPPKPDFDEPRIKLAKLREGEQTMTKEEYSKMKQELEA